MKIIVLLIACSILIATGFLIVFVWAIRSGQYDDTYSPSVRILVDDAPAEKKKNKPESTKAKH